MANQYYCPSVVRSVLVRITRNDVCGKPLLSTVAKSRFMFSCFSQLNLTPVYEDGDTNTVKDAAGRICIEDIACSQLKRLDGTLKLAGVMLNPLLEMVMGVRPLTGDIAQTAGSTLTDVYGGALPGLRGDVCESENFTIELWAKNAQPIACSVSAGTTYSWMQFALTKVDHWKLTNGLNFDGKPQEIELTFQARPNPNWLPPVSSEWATVDAITEMFAWRMKTAIPTSSVTPATGQCAFELAA